ncbi:MAG TPA: rod shape-determining protein MreD [Bacteroidia bacterium]|nr:rod shape-determining protein MreD [Bacteroidia bacterium]
MINEVIRHFIRFVLLVLAQGLILKNVEPGNFMNPFLYILFLIQLPFEAPAWLVLLLSFILGYSVDTFYQTVGMHMAACTFIGWVRPRLLRFLAPRDGYEFGSQPTMQDMGRVWFLTYATIIIVLHHLALFYLEMFSFREFFSTFIRVLISSAATLLLVVVTQFLFYRTKEAT